MVVVVYVLFIMAASHCLICLTCYYYGLYGVITNEPQSVKPHDQIPGEIHEMCGGGGGSEGWWRELAEAAGEEQATPKMCIG